MVEDGGSEVGVDFETWQARVPGAVRADALWRVQAYRMALYLGDLAWEDVTLLAGRRYLFALADQLYRAVGSISANIAEGYSRSSGRDRARFYEYALGSARESRDWYLKARHIIGPDRFQHRLEYLSRIIRLLLTMVPDQRGKQIREPEAPYDV